jgi:WD40 repeat protein
VHASPQYRVVGTVHAAHDRIIWSADWSPSGTFFATGSRDRVLKIWHLDPACPKMPTSAAAVLSGRQAAVTALAYMPVLPHAAADILAVGYEDGCLELLSVHSVSGVQGQTVATSQVRCLTGCPCLEVQQCLPVACA